MDLQKNEFKERLERIGAGSVPVNEITHSTPQKRRVPKSSRRNDFLENTRYPMKVLIVFLIGMLSVIISRYMRFHISGVSVSGEDIYVMTMIDSFLSMGVSFLFRIVITFEKPIYFTANTCGIFFMIVFMHNFVHMMPAFWSEMFSYQWVRHVVATTEPNSFLFLGFSFPFK